MTLRSPKPTRSGAARRRILIVDDDQAILTLFSTILRREGFDVATAADGLAALELLTRESFGVVLLDFAMPRLDGLGVLRRLQEAGIEVPVILISGSLDQVRQAEALRLGAAAILGKPPDASRLVRLCRELANLAPGITRLRH